MTDEEMSAAIGNRLQQERQRLGLSQGEFGKLAGVSRASQAVYEGGRSSPDLAYAIKASRAGVDMHYVLHGQTTIEASADTFDWELAGELMRVVQKVSADKGLVVPLEKVIPVIKILYGLNVGRSTPQLRLDTTRDVLRLL